ncbi:MAG: hypothetical protein IJS01_04780 [Lentisphaeria bacterium]|nr:hypothetical protein [Lentisphaeria bacterium]
MRSLGIDLGSNSLGWAILEQDRIVDQGVVIFDEGIIRNKGLDSLETPAAQRRKHRMARRLKFRRRIRKLHVLDILIDNGMCPLTRDELREMANHRTPPKNPAFIEWLKSVPSSEPVHINPYYARAAAAEHKIDPLLLGRALYHLAQRRGFKSSRKDQGESDEKENKKADDPGQVKRKIAELSAELAKTGCTLGQYFYRLNQSGTKIRKRHIGRVEHYQAEFARIAEVQNFSSELREKLFHALFSQRPLRSQKHLVGNCPLEKSRPRCQIGHPLFELFRMYSFINTIMLDDGRGMRKLNPEEREKVAAVFFRKERYFDFERIIGALYPRAKGKKKSDDPAPAAFNYRSDRTVPSCRVAHQLNKLLRVDDFLTWRRTRVRDGRERVYTYQTVFDALTFYDDDAMLRAFGKNTLGFDDEQAAELVKVQIPEGYANYSLYAVRLILPFLRSGIDLATSLILAKVPEVLGREKFESAAGRIIRDVLEIVANYRAEKKNAEAGTKLIPLNTRLRGYFENELELSPEQVDKLYWNTSVYAPVDDSGKPREILGPVQLGMIRNPLVQRSMTILRRLVNALRRAGKIDEFTQINIELARNVNDRNRRMAWETWQKQRAAARMAAVEELRPYLKDGADPSEDLIDRFILRTEQNGKCLYTGNSIGITDLLSENTPFDIEHTVPRSRSGDNSFANKTLCDSHYNRDIKKGRLPSECANYDEILTRIRPWIEKRDELRARLAGQKKSAKNADPSSPEKKAAAWQKALVTEFECRYWEKKVRYFEMSANEMEEGFLSRQLVDTGIMTRHAVAFLRSAYPNTYPVNGVAVAWARKCWGLQAQFEAKDRVDHTHHVLDAIVIAALDRKRFQEICSLFKDDGNAAYDPERRKELLAGIAPWKDFALSAKKAADLVFVKYLTRHHEFKQTFRNGVTLAHPQKTVAGKVLRKVPAAGDTVRGQLHEETFYGCITPPGAETQRFVVRKFIYDADVFKSIKDFGKIVDKGVRDAVVEQVNAYCAQGLSFKDAIQQPLWLKKPDADGKNGVPILRVRIFADSVTEPHRLRRQLTPSETEYKNFYYVNSARGANFRLALFLRTKKSKGQMVEYWDLEVDNILTRAKEMKDPACPPPEQRGAGKFLGFVYQGCAALKYETSPDELRSLSREELARRLYYFVKVEKSGRMTLKYHREARASGALADYLKSVGKNQDGESQFKFDELQELLYISPSNFKSHLLFEGIHFRISISGEITFL